MNGAVHFSISSNLVVLILLNNSTLHIYFLFPGFIGGLSSVLLYLYFLLQELQELHSAMEEAKADIVGLWALKFLNLQVGWLDPSTFLTTVFKKILGFTDHLFTYLICWNFNQGLLPGASLKSVYTTFLAGCFRSVRFGLTEAHG